MACRSQTVWSMKVWRKVRVSILGNKNFTVSLFASFWQLYRSFENCVPLVFLCICFLLFKQQHSVVTFPFSVVKLKIRRKSWKNLGVIGHRLIPLFFSCNWITVQTEMDLSVVVTLEWFSIFWIETFSPLQYFSRVPGYEWLPSFTFFLKIMNRFSREWHGFCTFKIVTYVLENLFANHCAFLEMKPFFYNHSLVKNP